MGKKLEQSPGTQRKYFTQETNTFAPFYFSYRTPCGLEGEKPNKTHIYLLLVTQNLALVHSKS